MRNQKQIDAIKSRIVEPYAIDNFITYREVEMLVSLFQTTNDNKVHKNTGPVTLFIDDYLNLPIFKTLFEKIEKEIGPFALMHGIWFSTNTPHIIHNDDSFSLPDNVYRAITIPLTLDGVMTRHEYPKLCMFDQFYFHGPAKFFNKSEDIPTFYNKQIYDYSEVDGTNDSFTIEREPYFTHLKPEWLEGLSVNSTFEWKPTSAIIFDSVRLHCASDFRKLGITEKLGLSIFTLKT